MKIKRICLCLCLFVCLIEPLAAQRLKKSKALKPLATEGYISTTFQLSAMNYFGDIPSGVLFTRPGINFYISRKLSPTYHARLTFSYGLIEGDDFSSPENSGTYARNLHFRNYIKELGVQLTKDIFGSYGKHSKRVNFTPYLIAGVALVHHNPQAKIPVELGNGWADLQPLGTEGQGRPGYGKTYSKIQVVIPLGIGLKWKIDKRWDFGVECVPRVTFTDYLDDISGDYPDMADLANPLAIALSNRTLESTAALRNKPRDLTTVFQNFGDPFAYIGFDGRVYRTLESFRRGLSTRGNPKSKDYYWITGFHLSYIINVGLKCPQFR